MHRFELWAPLATSVAVHLRAKNHLPENHSMDRIGELGWWRAEVADAGPGTDYGFLIDDDPTPYPDPRSQHQPDGVHALSRIYDQNAFPWSDMGFQPLPLASAIVYELHLG